MKTLNRKALVSVNSANHYISQQKHPKHGLPWITKQAIAKSSLHSSIHYKKVNNFSLI